MKLVECNAAGLAAIVVYRREGNIYIPPQLHPLDIKPERPSRIQVRVGD